MKPLRLKPNKQTILGLAGALVLLVLACIGLFVKQQATLAVAAANLAAKQKQVDEGTAVASRLASVEGLLQKDRDELKNLEHSLPNTAYVPTLLRQVEGLARETHNVVRGVRPKIEVAPPPRRERRSDPEAAAKGDEADAEKSKDQSEKKAPEPYDKLKIQLSLTGRYADCLQFIHRLTNFPKIVAVNEVQLRPKFDEKTSAPALDVDLNLTAFILKENAQPQPEVTKEGQAT
jgi:Tfp pilus assembly protein PilO